MADTSPAPFRGLRPAIGILAASLMAPATGLGQPEAAAEPLRDRPSVKQLLLTCERALAAGNVGVDAAICEWYAVPCDCSLTQVQDEPPRCVPPSLSIEATMRRVVLALRSYPDPETPAEVAVAEILARLYPCE